MQYLIDTNIWLWWLIDDKALKESTRKLLKEPENTIFISVASVWEVCIKQSKGKLPLKTTVEECINLSGFQVLPIKVEHVLQVGKLPFHHNDPFDRILIAQSQVEKIPLITSDEKILKYDVSAIKI